MTTDSRGVLRGTCKRCADCENFTPLPNSSRCICGCPPGRHEKMESGPPCQQLATSLTSVPATAGAICLICDSEVHFDVNTGIEYKYCEEHLKPDDCIEGLDVTQLAQHLPIPQAQCISVQPKAAFGHAVCALEGCLKPRYIGTDGTVYECCGIRHARELKEKRASHADSNDDGATSPDQMCIFQGCKKERFREGEKMHKFCGRTHADLYQQQQQLNEDPRLICCTPNCKNLRCKKDEGDEYYDYCSLYCRDNPQKEGTVMLSPSKRGICSLPTCHKFKYQDPSNGRIHEFCSRKHAFEGRKSGVQGNAIGITLATSKESTDITRKFTVKWASGKGKCPSIDYVFSICNSKLKQRWKDYKSTLPLPDNTEEYFHGTKLECDITNTNSLCCNQGCGVCGIANIGFDRRCIRKNINFQRFGHGFYLAPNSSKCHDYTQGKNGYRAMLLFDVCPGNKFQLQRDDEKLTAPPQGYNSVHGKAGISLNYDELVLYNPDAALPKYIIVYQKDGDDKIAK